MVSKLSSLDAKEQSYTRAKHGHRVANAIPSIPHGVAQKVYPVKFQLVITSFILSDQNQTRNLHSTRGNHVSIHEDTLLAACLLLVLLGLLYFYQLAAEHPVQ